MIRSLLAGTEEAPGEVIIDDLRIVDVNEAICARYGFTRAEMIGKRWAELGVGLPADQRVQIYERDLGRGNRLITHVFWADPEADARAR